MTYSTDAALTSLVAEIAEVRGGAEIAGSSPWQIRLRENLQRTEDTLSAFIGLPGEWSALPDLLQAIAGIEIAVGFLHEASGRLASFSDPVELQGAIGQFWVAVSHLTDGLARVAAAIAAQGENL